MVLYLAEKKVLAEAIAEALPGAAQSTGGVIYKGDNVITWLSGHLLALKDPEDYNPDFKKWDLSVLPLYFPNWENKPGKGNEERVKQIGELIKKADTIVNCGDVDEEGQLLVDEMLRWFNYNGVCKRLDTANTTIPALKKALSRMKDNSEMENDGYSAYARQVSDMLFGINLTRYYSKKYNALLTVGRVQTPTLGLVVNRDLQIESHKKVFYYTLNGMLTVADNRFSIKYTPEKDLPELTDGKFLSDVFLREIVTDFSGKTLSYTVKKERQKKSAPLPYNLTELNKDCGKKWGYNPDRVMRITQSLRDDFSAITYNRSDCQYLSTEHFREAPGTIKAACKNLSIDATQFDSSIKSRAFNDANITAHFAIIPTETDVDVAKLSTEQKNVYELICRQYLAQFMPQCVEEKTNIMTPLSLNGKSIGKFEGTETVIISPGYLAFLKPEKAIEKKDDEDSAEDENAIGLSNLNPGKYDGIISSEKDFRIDKKVTKPPQRYTQTDLYDDMTRISKYVDDPAIKRLLEEKDKDKKGENGSIGTSATRAEIITKLIKNGYLEEQDTGKKKILISTAKGRTFYKMLPESIKKADTTALWWVIQEDIKAGRKPYNALIEKVLETVTKVVNGSIAPSEDTDMSKLVQSNDKPLCKCPSCKGDIIKGKFGPYCKQKCGFVMGMVCGKKVNETEFVYLCQGKKVMMRGLKKKAGGTFDAYVQSKGIEEFSYEKDGTVYNGKRLKFDFTFPTRRR
ncbi:MAG: type IA DNA topoisomerase [Clostridiales bacterium]|nr:type IA DNA topoisomerase [Clostridiales bacterium]